MFHVKHLFGSLKGFLTGGQVRPYEGFYIAPTRGFNIVPTLVMRHCNDPADVLVCLYGDGVTKTNPRADKSAPTRGIASHHYRRGEFIRLQRECEI